MPRYDDSSDSDNLDDGGLNQMHIVGGNVGNIVCPLCLLIAILCIFTQVHHDSCSRPLGPFLVGCGVVYFITVLAACCGVGSSGFKDNPIAKIASTLNGFTGCFMVIWLCMGIYWLATTEKEPTGGILNSATGLVGGSVAAATGAVGTGVNAASNTVGNVANAASNTVGVGNVVGAGNIVGVGLVTVAPVTLTQSLAAQGLCNKHLWNMSLVIIIMSFLWCPCLLAAMVCMLWGTVKGMTGGKKDRQGFSSDGYNSDGVSSDNR